MAVTVEQVMELEAFSEATQLIAGAAGVKNAITYVTISEAPDFYEWVSGGEFVLTTLYAFRDHPELRVPAYTELAKRKVAAFGIKVNRFFDAVPADLIAIAEEYQIPLFAIKRETKFRQIVQAISAELNSDQTNLLLEVEGHYKELVKVALVGGGFNEYLQGFGRRKKSPVYCFEADFKLLGSYAKAAEVEAVQEIQDKLAGFVERAGEVVQQTRQAGLHIFPCVMRGAALGYLVVVDAEPLSEKLVLMANQLTAFLTMKLIDQMETAQKMLAALLEDILFKQNLTEEEVRARLTWHGLPHREFYRVLVVKDKNPAAAPALGGVAAKCCNRIRQLLDGALVIAKPEESIIIAAQEAADGTDAPAWLSGLGEAFASPDARVLIGVGPQVNTALEIRGSYDIAKGAVRAGSAVGQGGVLYYAHFLARLPLLRAAETSEAEHLVNRVILPLVAQDKRYNTQLLQTLDALLFADDLEAAATKLFVHVNTVRYRINKISTLAGYDFFSARGRFVLSTAYLLYRYRQ